MGHKNCVPLQPLSGKRGVAQLVAFLVWDQAVAGSSPVTSTKKVRKIADGSCRRFFLFKSLKICKKSAFITALASKISTFA